ncbi:MAG: hypothetical protein JO257_30840 [Deltaproteobacteria bacterium]|nr:hypothetical protein [Deltaproteobacteria bacterium]
MRLLLAAGIAACHGSSPAPHLRFGGESDAPGASSTALNALAGGEIPIDASWKSDDRVASVLTVTCQPACATERHSPEHVIVHPPGIGALAITATTTREGSREQLSATRTYNIVRAEDIGIVCRDAHHAVLECDVPQNAKTATAEVVAYIGGKPVAPVGGMRIDGKEVPAGPFLLSALFVHAPGLHTIELSGGGLKKHVVIAIAPD